MDSSSAVYVLGSGQNQGSYQQASAEAGGAGGTTELKQAGSWNIELGSVLRPAEGTLRPYVLPVAGSPHMTAAGAMSVANGKVTRLVDSPRSGGAYVVLDARCSDSVFAWSELDLSSHAWRLYAAPLEASGLGAASTLWEAGADYDPPRMCCSGSSVIWLVMPSASGSRAMQNSSCYLWQVGAGSADEVVRSPGRFACAPAVSDGMVTLAPRVKTATSGKFYGITAYTLDSGLSTVSAQLVLPQSVQPLYAVRMGDVFAFSIEANYGSGGLLGTMGTFIGNDGDPFVVLPREPAAQISGNGGIYLIKTQASHLIVDTNAKTYATLSAPNRSLDYGDYSASEGTTSTFVAFSTVKDAETGFPSAVTVRSFAL